MAHALRCAGDHGAWVTQDREQPLRKARGHNAVGVRLAVGRLRRGLNLQEVVEQKVVEEEARMYPPTHSLTHPLSQSVSHSLTLRNSSMPPRTAGAILSYTLERHRSTDCSSTMINVEVDSHLMASLLPRPGPRTCREGRPA